MQRTTSGLGTAGRIPGYEAQAQIDQAWRPWVKLLEVALEADESAAWVGVPEIRHYRGAGPPYAPLLEGSSASMSSCAQARAPVIHIADEARDDGANGSTRARRRLDAVALLNAG